MSRQQALLSATWLLTATIAVSACGSGGAVRAQQSTAVNGTARVQPSNAARTERSDAARPLRVLVGWASYYSDKLAGHRTSSGERYDPAQRTAANRDLPLGSVVKVVRSDTGAQVIVRINDRGPFGDRRRILDLSRAAARELGIIGMGVARVRAEVLQYGAQAKRASSARQQQRGNADRPR